MHCPRLYRSGAPSSTVPHVCVASSATSAAQPRTQPREWRGRTKRTKILRTVTTASRWICARRLGQSALTSTPKSLRGSRVGPRPSRCVAQSPPAGRLLYRVLTFGVDPARTGFIVCPPGIDQATAPAVDHTRVGVLPARRAGRVVLTYHMCERIARRRGGD
jgi:hypothetical protein